MSDTEIIGVHGRRVWDSRGRPTVEVDVTLAGGAFGRAIAPAGASTGAGEAVDLRDGGPAFGGLDVRRAVANVETLIAPALIGRDALDQAGIDAALIALDGTPNKARLGGNAVIATSMAVLHAAAASQRLPLWQLSGGGRGGQPSRCPKSRFLGAGRMPPGASTSRISWSSAPTPHPSRRRWTGPRRFIARRGGCLPIAG